MDATEFNTKPEELKFSTLPIPELCIGVFLVLVSHVLAPSGDEVSLARTAIMFAISCLVIAYGMARNVYAPFYCYAFITPIFPAFGTSIALIAGGSALVWADRKRSQFAWHFSGIGLAFCLLLIVGLFWGNHFPYQQDSFIAQAIPPMFLAMMIAGIRNPVFRRNLILMVICACLIGSMLSLYHWVRGGVGVEGRVGRVFSGIRPDLFSAWELMGLLGTLGWLIRGGLRGWLRWAFICALPPIALGIGLCGYRAAIISAGLGIIIISICQRRFLQGMFLMFLAAIPVIMVGIMVPAIFAPLISRFQTIGTDRGSERLDIWQGALTLFGGHPILGLGTDNFRFEIARYYGQQILPHSIYIESLVELGVVGIVMLLIWLATLWRKTWRAEDRVWIFPLMAVYCFQGMLLHLFFFPSFWLMIGLAEGCVPAKKQLPLAPRSEFDDDPPEPMLSRPRGAASHPALAPQLPTGPRPPRARAFRRPVPQ